MPYKMNIFNDIIHQRYMSWVGKRGKACCTQLKLQMAQKMREHGSLMSSPYVCLEPVLANIQ